MGFGGLSLTVDAFKEQRALGFCGRQQPGPRLWGQVLQVMSAPNWGGEMLPPLQKRKTRDAVMISR